jgi:sulfur-carrier protein
MDPADQRAPDHGAARPGGAQRSATGVLVLFAAARVAAGTGRAEVCGRTVGDVLDQARVRFGEGFATVLDRSRVWVNGEPAGPEQVLHNGDEIAVLPPVSGGAR